MKSMLNENIVEHLWIDGVHIVLKTGMDLLIDWLKILLLRVEVDDEGGSCFNFTLHIVWIKAHHGLFWTKFAESIGF